MLVILSLRLANHLFCRPWLPIALCGGRRSQPVSQRDSQQEAYRGGARHIAFDMAKYRTRRSNLAHKHLRCVGDAWWACVSVMTRLLVCKPCQSTCHAVRFVSRPVPRQFYGVNFLTLAPALAW